MKTMKWLLRREFWEHKGAMLWAPAVAAVAMLVLMFLSLAFALSKGLFDGHLIVNGKEKVMHFSVADLLSQGGGVAEMVANGYMAASAPLFIMLAAVVFFYCLGALHDERRDRSILFWKSLPVSDNETVLSKVITAAIVAPLITIAIAVFMSVLMVLLAALLCAFHGVNMIGPLLSQPAFYLTPLQIVGLLPVYVLWALPTIGWLLLVSSWAKSKVFLWAVGVPILAIVMLKWVDYLLGVGLDLQWFTQNVIARGLFGLVPGVWLPMEQVNPHTMVGAQRTVAMSAVFTQSWMTLAAPSVWVGAVVGGAMIYGAARLRRWKDEG